MVEVIHPVEVTIQIQDILNLILEENIILDHLLNLKVVILVEVVVLNLLEVVVVDLLEVVVLNLPEVVQVNLNLQVLMVNL